MTRDQLLMPVRPVFIWVSLLMSVVIGLIPFGRQPALPDIFGLVFLFWCLYQPRYVGVTLGFLFGIIFDVNAGSILGQHSLSFIILAYCASLGEKRILLFSPLSQSIQIFPLLLLQQLIVGGVRLLAGGSLPGWGFLLAPVFEMLLWPALVWILLIPQRRAPNRDKTRPVL